MENIKSTNSARLLYKILKSGWEMNNDLSCADVWKNNLSNFNLESKDPNANMLELYGLFVDTINDIKAHDTDEKDEKLSYLTAITTIFNFFVQKNIFHHTDKWSKVKGIIRNDTLSLVNAAGRLLNENKDANFDLPNEEISKLRDTIRNLIEEIYNIPNNKIDQYVKSTIISELMGIEETLLHYGIRGSSGLLKVSDKATGAMVRVTNYLCSNFSDSASSEITKITKEYINQVIVIAFTIAGLATGQAINLLPENTQEIINILPDKIETNKS